MAPLTSRADRTGIVFGEHHRRREHVVRRHHLATAHVGTLAQLARRGEIAFLHQVLHPHAPIHDDEAVGLLHHEADQAGGRLQPAAAQSLHHVALGLDDGDGSERLVAPLDAGTTGCAIGTGRAVDQRAALPLLVAGGPRTARTSGRTERQNKKATGTRPMGRWIDLRITHPVSAARSDPPRVCRDARLVGGPS